MLRRFLLGLSALVPALAVALPAPALAQPSDSATIHPGVQTITAGGQCTANFVFSDGTDLYLGQAAHCAGTGGATATNGCDTESLPVGTPVEIEGAGRPGELAYSSWIAMREVGETDENACNFNDFALVRIHPDDQDTVSTAVPFWGGPVGIEEDGTTAGERVYTYGNSSLRLGLDALKPKTGVSTGTAGGGWTHNVYTVSPGIPGDSGSAFLDAEGKALGTLSTLQFAPLAGSNGVSDLARQLDYANEVGGMGVDLLQVADFDPVL